MSIVCRCVSVHVSVAVSQLFVYRHMYGYSYVFMYTYGCIEPYVHTCTCIYMHLSKHSYIVYLHICMFMCVVIGTWMGSRERIVTTTQMITLSVSST